MSTAELPDRPAMGLAELAATPGQTDTAVSASRGGRIEVNDVTASYHGRPAVTDVDIVFDPGQVTALIGPSGCGKTTLLRCLNGLHMTVPGASVTGQVLLDDVHIYENDVDLVQVRRYVGMVFQRPNPFPTMSIADNVTSLSGGQQQRLCIARSLAVQPQVLLMDEPCSALDPVSTLVIEGLIDNLKKDYTVVIVTHNMQQAARVSDVTAFFTVKGPGQPGQLVEVSPTKELFSNPTQQETVEYITGKVG